MADAAGQWSLAASWSSSSSSSSLSVLGGGATKGRKRALSPGPNSPTPSPPPLHVPIHRHARRPKLSLRANAPLFELPPPPSPPAFLPVPGRGAAVGPAGGPLANAIEQARWRLAAALVGESVPGSDIRRWSVNVKGNHPRTGAPTCVYVAPGGSPVFR